MIEARDLTKLYTGAHLFPFRRKRASMPAVNKLSLKIEDGQIFGLLGVNGAGKTTTVKMLCTLLEPTFGWATVGGYDVVRQAGEVRSIINMIAGGERMLYWRLTGRENLNYFADLYDVDRSVAQKRIDSLLDMVGLTDSANQRVEQYSKGMKQRLHIARGLINDPRYLFLDEPTIGLDAPIAREIRRVIKRLNKAILFTTHYMDEAEELCDEIAILHKGEIVERGTADQLKRRYKTTYAWVVTLEGEADAALDQALENFSRAHAASVSTQTVELGYQLHVRAPTNVTSALVDAVTPHRRILELRAVEPSLEDVLVAISSGVAAPDRARA